MWPSELCQLAISIMIPLLMAMLATSASGANSDLQGWFANKLKKPTWTPPAWVFPPVWILVYVCAGIASWLVWRQGGLHYQGKALGLYAVTLALTFAWPLIFFRLYRMDWALVEMLLMTLSEVATFMAFSKAIGLLLVLMLLGPLLAWTGFSIVLLYALIRKNPPRRGGLALGSAEDGTSVLGLRPLL